MLDGYRAILKRIKYSERGNRKTLAIVEQLLNVLSAFEPFIFSESELLSHELHELT